MGSLQIGQGILTSTPSGPAAHESVLIAKILAEELADTSGPTRLGAATNLVGTGLRALVDLALLVLDDNAEILALILAIGLSVDEPLEALLLALEGSEGLGVAIGELSVELGVVERGGAKVVALHLGVLGIRWLSLNPFWPPKA